MGDNCSKTIVGFGPTCRKVVDIDVFSVTKGFKPFKSTEMILVWHLVFSKFYMFMAI